MNNKPSKHQLFIIKTVKKLHQKYPDLPHADYLYYAEAKWEFLQAQKKLNKNLN